MVNLILAAPNDLWAKLIGWFNGFIPSYGWTIVVITILLKLVLTPLDVWQRIISKKNTEKMAVLQPQIEKLNKRYANDKEKLNQKTMELYKKENYNVMGFCLPMLINMVLTLVIFITFFNSLNGISQYKVKTEYETLQATYIQTLKTELIDETSFTEIDNTTLKQILDELSSSENYDTLLAEAKATAQSATLDKFTEIKEGFLWVKNIFRPDTYASVFPDAKEFINISGTKFNYSAENKFINIYGEEFDTKTAAKQAFINDFNDVTAEINKEYSGWNGYLILVVLAALITVGSQLISQIGVKKTVKDKKGNELQVQNPGSNKLMMFLLPALMVVISLQYSAAFALYIVVNSLMSALIGLATNLILVRIEKKKEGVK